MLLETPPDFGGRDVFTIDFSLTPGGGGQALFELIITGFN